MAHRFGWMTPILIFAQLDSIPWTVTVWGQNRSNCMDRDMGNRIFRGGFIAPEMVASTGVAQGSDMGVLGLTSGIDCNGLHTENGGIPNARVCGSVQGKLVGDARWTAGDVGFGVFWQCRTPGSVGCPGWLAHSNCCLDECSHKAWKVRTKIALSWGWSIFPFTGERLFAMDIFIVDEAVDSLQASMRAEAEISQRAAWGAAINAEWHFLREEAPFAFHLRLQNLGWAVVPSMTQWQVDTMIETTGLTFQGPDWIVGGSSI